MSAVPIIVVGSGLAGTRTAIALRRHAPGQRVVLLGDEPRPAYERPPLSKEFLAGSRDATGLTLAGAGFAELAERGIVARGGQRVASIDASGVRLEGGERLEASAIVLATGARPRQLQTSCDPQAVHVLRSLDDAARLRATLRAGRHLVIIGSGFVGAEVASSALQLGVHVTMLEAARVPFERTLGGHVGTWLAERWRAAGIDLHLGAMVEAIEACADAPVRVRLADGTRIDGDEVLVAIGTVPNDDLYHVAFPGLGVPGHGVPTNADGRTPVDGVWAAGDVALVASSTGSRRVEHWTDAALAAERVARGIAGLEAPPASAPYAWSDQFGVRVQVAGHAGAHLDAHVDASGDALLVRYLDDAGRLHGVVGIGHPGYVAQCRRDLAA